MSVISVLTSPLQINIGTDLEVKNGGFKSHPIELIIGEIGEIVSTVRLNTATELAFPEVSVFVTV